MTTKSPSSSTRDCDVIVLGSGIGGSLFATVLARKGLDVVLIEKGSHPRFAIGESTTPESTALMGILAQRYDVPEIANLSNFASVRRHVSSACGVKRNFTYAFHREGQPQRADHFTQFPTWAPPFGPDIHFFRQDTDSYVFGLAVRYGVTILQQTGVDTVDVHDDGVTVVTAKGQTVRGKFIIDGTGRRGTVGKVLGLRLPPDGMRTDSRALFTHMIGVLPYDRCAPDRREHGMPSPFHQGTLHHIFEGGWLWVIPFDNHKASTNPLCSVGLCLDRERWPRPEGVSPEEEFRQFVERFPSLRKQFEGATAVRGWVASDRMQYRSKRCGGARYFLMPSAAGFVDALFSSGLTFTAWAINVAGEQIVESVRHDDFRDDRFDHVNEWFDKCLDYYDRLVAHSYRSFSSFELWNAWHRVWTLGSLYGVSGQHEVFSRAAEDPSAYEGFERKPYRGIQAVDLDSYRQLFDDACAIMEEVQRGTLSEPAATQRMFALLASCPLCPEPWKVTDAQRRYPATFTLVPMVRLLMWARRHGPQDVRDNYFRGGRALGWLGSMWNTQMADRLHSSSVMQLWRSSFFSWNTDWK
nr:NAD(P)/FAD-dependent oxidoreductase [Deltaproteobacteria bacterium]